MRLVTCLRTMLTRLPIAAPTEVIARLLNRLLGREPWARDRLSPHAGKTVRFVLGTRPVSLTIASQGTTHAADPAVVPNVILSIPPHQLVQLPGALSKRDPAALTALLHIEGDAGLANTVSGLANDLRWDIEHDLAERIGDIAALRVLSIERRLRLGLIESAARLRDNVGEYLAYESGLLASRQGVLSWQHKLQQLHHQLDELEARSLALDDKARAPSPNARQGRKAPTKKATLPDNRHA